MGVSAAGTGLRGPINAALSPQVGLKLTANIFCTMALAPWLQSTHLLSLSQLALATGSNMICLPDIITSGMGTRVQRDSLTSIVVPGIGSRVELDSIAISAATGIGYRVESKVTEIVRALALAPGLKSTSLAIVFMTGIGSGVTPESSASASS
jgi:hypothetical protein